MNALTFGSGIKEDTHFYQFSSIILKILKESIEKKGQKKLKHTYQKDANMSYLHMM